MVVGGSRSSGSRHGRQAHGVNLTCLDVIGVPDHMWSISRTNRDKASHVHVASYTAVLIHEVGVTRDINRVHSCRPKEEFDAEDDGGDIKCSYMTTILCNVMPNCIYVELYIPLSVICLSLSFGCNITKRD